MTVVVEFNELGGGVQEGCAASGEPSASSMFAAAGFALDYVQRQPSFVCRVAGKPLEDVCASAPPVDAYWALYWSDGTDGSWSYATTGVTSLEVPAGGYVAFVWQGTNDQTAPATTPSPRVGSSPGAEPTSDGSEDGGSETAGASTGEPASNEARGDSTQARGGVPGWVSGTLLALLVLAAAAVAVVRRRGSHSP